MDSGNGKVSGSFPLSEAQRRIIEHRGCDLQIIACAGAGKTEAVSRRVAAILAEGIEPAAVIAFTFTEKAGAELKERIYRWREIFAREFPAAYERHSSPPSCRSTLSLVRISMRVKICSSGTSPNIIDRLSTLRAS